MLSPNTAFAQLRDNDVKYFIQSIGILLLSSCLGALIALPFIMMPLDGAYYDEIDEMIIPADGIDIVLVVSQGILSGIVSAVLLYFIGKKLGGNTAWKKVFTVFFHTYVPTIPMTLVVAMLVFLMWSSLTSIDPSLLLTPEENEEQVLSLLGPMLAYAGLVALTAILFLIWIFIISVKAIKTLNGFGTGKAFGLLVLVLILAGIVTSPLGM